MARTVLVFSAFVLLSGCAYGPAGGYEETQDEPSPPQSAAAVSHVAAQTKTREHLVRPEPAAPIRELEEGHREPITQDVK